MQDLTPIDRIPGQRWIVGALLALFAIAGAVSLRQESATFDETAHLPAGYTYLDRLDFRLNPEHPPLLKAWAAFAPWIAGRGRPDYESSAWRGRPVGGGPEHSKASQWLFGYELLNGPLGTAERRDPRALLLPARTAMLLPGLLLGWIVYLWSRELWGPTGGLLSLFLYCLSPTMLAHTRLVTTDLPTALAWVATLWCFYRLTRRPTRAGALLFAAVFGLALLVKFSTLLLVPTVGLLALLWIAWPDADDRRARVRWSGWALGLAALVAFTVLWAGYGFRFSAAADASYRLDWEIVGSSPAWIEAAIQRVLSLRLLPEAYLYGLAYFLGGAARRLAYLNGEQSIVGWWSYFPEAFLFKTPIATLLLGSWLAVRSVVQRRWGFFGGWFLLLPIVLYVGVSIASNLNIGHRHLAPVYPLLFVLLGALGNLLGADWRRRLPLLLLLVAYLWSFAAATPRYLSYFNVLAGGPGGGPRYLLDSNLDWGQDLPRLKRWMDRERVPAIHLAYFGTADPAAYEIAFSKVFLVHDFQPDAAQSWPESGELMAVSVNLLYGLYYDEDRAIAERLVRPGWLDASHVREWLRLRDGASRRGERHPDLAEWLLARGLTDPGQLERVRSGLLSTRMRELRESGPPLARPGDSIWVYEVP